MATTARNRTVGYPPGWSTWDAHNNSYTLAHFELPAIPGTRLRVTRFGARYRAAFLYEGSTFGAMGASTARGYSRLVHLGLMFSAAESLKEILQVHDRNTTNLLTLAERTTYRREIRRADRDNLIMTGVQRDTRRGTLVRAAVDAYLARGDASIYLLAKAARSAFVHGSLTPNIGGTTPLELGQVVDTLNDALKTMMDQQFGGRMARFEAKYLAPGSPADGVLY